MDTERLKFTNNKNIITLDVDINGKNIEELGLKQRRLEFIQKNPLTFKINKEEIYQ
jgi:hypothetical protein